MNKKAWWKSKTLWVNAVGLLALGLQAKFGFLLDAEAQAALLGLVNVLLRLITNEAVGFQDEAAPPAGAPLNDYGPPKGPGA